MRDLDVRWIDSLREGDAACVGAKVYRLGELSRIGISVPRGFAVPASAFEFFLESSDSSAEIADALRALDHKDETALARAAGRIERCLAAATLSPALRASIEDAYTELCRRCGSEVSVAVRSSGVREDGATVSFAGQYTTVLGSRGTQRVLESVKECWASAFSAHVLGYALRNGISPLEAPLAVGIMTLVPARSAGVAFSVHPTTGSRSRMLIEANWGWGEAVVQGVVTPDSAEVDKSDGRVLVYRINAKRVVSAFDELAGRVVEGPMPPDLVDRRVLDEDEIRCLHAAVIAIENHYGTPVDVEWAIDREREDDERVTIVQTRPITSLPEPPVTAWDPFASAMRFAVKP